MPAGAHGPIRSALSGLKSASSLVRRDGPRPPVRPRLRRRNLAVGKAGIAIAVQQSAGHASLTLFIGAVGAFARIVILTALGTPGIVARRCRRDRREPGEGCRTECQQRQLRLAHDLTPLLTAYDTRHITSGFAKPLYSNSTARHPEKSPAEPAGLQSRTSQDRYSTFRPANSTTFFHFSVSDLISSPNASGVCARGSPPSSTRRLAMSGSFISVLISLLSLAMISLGVFFGAPMPNSALAS